MGERAVHDVGGTSAEALVRFERPGASGGSRWVETVLSSHLNDSDVQGEENQRLIEIFDLTDDLVMLIDAEGRLMYMNRAGRRFHGLDDRDYAVRLGTRWPMSLQIGRSVLQRLHHMPDADRWSGQLEAVDLDDRKVAMRLEVIVHRDDSGALSHYSAVAHDVSERSAWEAALEHQATHDALTGLPNRTLLLDEIRRRLRSDQVRGGIAALLFIDLDNFKVINDSLGHDLGDKLLQSVAARISSSVRPDDIVARFAGDEFVVLCTGLAHRDEATAVANRINKALNEVTRIDGHDIHAGVSMGISYAVAGDFEPEALLRDADTAMYQAKAEGRNHWVVFDEGLRQRAVDRQRNEAELRRALAAGELELHYQPIMELNNGRVAGLEALLRWELRGELITADRFIPLAEETGLIVPIGAWVLEEACREAVRWQRLAGMAHVGVSVNVSARQLQFPAFLAGVRSILEEDHIAPDTLTLEITEGVLVQDIHKAIGVLEELRGMGIHLALDDFGSGNSPLSYLNLLPIDVVKLDRSFVAGVGSDPGDTAIVTAMVGLAAAIGLDVVAEGVETEGQRRELTRLGCRFGQGHLVSCPVPAREVMALLGARSPRPSDAPSGRT